MGIRSDMSPQDLDQVLTDLSVHVRNNALEAAAKVAKLYGASDEVVERILMLRGKALPERVQ
jgi:ribosome-associated translation inhibitor RaiA